MINKTDRTLAREMIFSSGELFVLYLGKHKKKFSFVLTG